MRKELLPIAVLGFLVFATPLCAEELAMPEGAAAKSSAGLPSKGMSMSKVEATYGAPSNKRPAVGGGSPQQPPITRWDYPAFSVFFERDMVVHSVIPGAPPPIVNRQGLEPSDGPPPAAMFEEADEAMPLDEDAPVEPVSVPTSDPTATYAEDPGLVEDRENALRERQKAETAAEPAEETMPEEAMPEEAMPEEAMPEEAMPEEAMPEEAMPEEAMPEEAMPEQDAPETMDATEQADEEAPDSFDEPQPLD